MAISLERSESYETYSTKEPVPVASTQVFERYIVGKSIKNVSWDDNGRGAPNNMLIEFTDQSTLLVGSSPTGPNLGYVPAPLKKK